MITESSGNNPKICSDIEIGVKIGIFGEISEILGGGGGGGPTW
jgi:hypothetical protein